MQTVLAVIGIVVGAFAAFAGGVYGNGWLQLRERRILLMTELIPVLVSHIMDAESQVRGGMYNPFRNDVLTLAHKIQWLLAITPGKPAVAALAQLKRLQVHVVHANDPRLKPDPVVLEPVLAEVKQSFRQLQRHLAKKLHVANPDELPIP